MQLFLMSCSEGKSPVIMESITLPCLKILQAVIKPDPPMSKKFKVIFTVPSFPLIILSFLVLCEIDVFLSDYELNSMCYRISRSTRSRGLN